MLLLVGLLVSLLFSRPRESLGLTYFIKGAVPLVIFSPSLFGAGNSGAIHTPKVICRFVNRRGRDSRASQSAEDQHADFNASLSGFLAVLIVWAVSNLV